MENPNLPILPGHPSIHSKKKTVQMPITKPQMLMFSWLSGGHPLASTTFRSQKRRPRVFQQPRMARSSYENERLKLTPPNKNGGGWKKHLSLFCIVLPLRIRKNPNQRPGVIFFKDHKTPLLIIQVQTTLPLQGSNDH